MPADSPNVYFPPPFLFVIGFGTGLLLSRWWPLPLLSSHHPLSLVLAWLMVGGGLGLVAWALLTFRRARTGILPFHPASALLSGGPYAFSRNPMYVALGFVYAGLALWMNTLWPLALLPGVLYVLWLTVIRREEQYLTRAFGAEYAAYQQRVRRWL